MSDPFEEAYQLLQVEPQPEDIVERLDEIRKRVPRKLRPAFDYHYEAAALDRPPGNLGAES